MAMGAAASAAAKAALVAAKRSAARATAKVAGSAAGKAASATGRSIAKHSPQWLKTTGSMAKQGVKGSWNAFRGQSKLTQFGQLAGAGMGFWGLYEICKGSDDGGGDDGGDSGYESSIFDEAGAPVAPAMGQAYYEPAGASAYYSQNSFDSHDPYYMPTESYIRDDGSYVTPSGASYNVDAKEFAKTSDNNPMISVAGRQMPLDECMYEYSTGINYNA